MPKIDKAKMKCNKPKRQISGGKKSVVKACDKGTLDKLKAKYWSCKAW